jgi:hypothetical protein
VTKGHWSAAAAAAVLVGGGVAAVVAARQRNGGQLPRNETRERNLRTYVELMRSDIRTQKVALITEALLLSEAEDAIFWPIYRAYALELSRLYDERIRLIDTYGENYTSLSDEQADDLVVKALDLESRRTDLKQKYYGQLKAALPPRLALKALHIEHQLELLVDLQIDASLPVMATE